MSGTSLLKLHCGQVIYMRRFPYKLGFKCASGCQSPFQVTGSANFKSPPQALRKRCGHRDVPGFEQPLNVVSRGLPLHGRVGRQYDSSTPPYSMRRSSELIFRFQALFRQWRNYTREAHDRAPIIGSLFYGNRSAGLRHRK